MRIRTDSDYAHRPDMIEAAMDVLNESSKIAAVLAACEHARQDRLANGQPKNDKTKKHKMLGVGWNFYE